MIILEIKIKGQLHNFLEKFFHYCTGCELWEFGHTRYGIQEGMSQEYFDSISDASCKAPSERGLVRCSLDYGNSIKMYFEDYVSMQVLKECIKRAKHYLILHCCEFIEYIIYKENIKHEILDQGE